MMTWADGRAKPQAQKISEQIGAEKISRKTGCMATALYYPARILWLRSNRPDIFRKSEKFVSIKDAVVHRLTGKWVTDKSHASSNGLLDINRLKWEAELLEAIGISPEQLPELVDSDVVAGELSKAMAQKLGLCPGIPVIAGAGDGGLANLGSGAILPGQAAATIGSTGAVRKIFDRPWTNGKAGLWCYYLASGLWYAGGAINSGGIVLRWLRDGLLPDLRDRALAKGVEPYAAIIKLAMSAPPGADGLMFLPYVFGERTPYWNPLAKGVFFGLAPQHNQAHIARAVLEGITMGMAHIFALLENSPAGMKEVRASGGFARSELWVQLLADMTGKPVRLPKVRENSALGAVILAMKATGALKSLRDSSGLVKVSKTFEPDPGKTRFYQERLEMFKRLYQDLENDFGLWAAMQKKGTIK
jgi:gluconokinase